MTQAEIINKVRSECTQLRIYIRLALTKPGLKESEKNCLEWILESIEKCEETLKFDIL